MKLKKSLLKKLFSDFFGFEEGIDISDETQVLYRKNKVIKNIIFVSNIIYTIIMLVMSFLLSSESNNESNWILTAILFPLTFLINSTLKKMINANKNDFMKQQIAMYFAVFYMFVLSIIMYVKMKTSNGIGEDGALSESGYILIYYSLVVVSLYQDKKMLKTVCKWVLVMVTILHFTVTYNMLKVSFEGNNIWQKFLSFLTDERFVDIVLRTLILGVFMIVLNVIVSLSQYMQEERKKELVKRKKVQDDFTKVVTDLFDVTLGNLVVDQEEIKHINTVAALSKKFASIIGLTPNECDEIERFAEIHLKQRIDLDLSNITDNDMQFEHLRNQTTLGNQIIKRVELERRCVDIIRAHGEGWDDSEQIANLKHNKVSTEDQIVLICDIYVSLRSFRSYKRPHPHKLSIEIMEQHFRGYFDSAIFERFIRFQDQFEQMYDQL